MRALVSASSRRQQQRRHPPRPGCPRGIAASFIWDNGKGRLAAAVFAGPFPSGARRTGNLRHAQVDVGRLGASAARLLKPAAARAGRKGASSIFPSRGFCPRAVFCSKAPISHPSTLLPAPAWGGGEFLCPYPYPRHFSCISCPFGCLLVCLKRSCSWIALGFCHASSSRGLELRREEQEAMVGLKMLPQKLLLVAVVLCFFEGEGKFGENMGKKRRCLNGSPPRRLKKRERRLMLLEPPSVGELMCRGFYPRLSCCPRAESPGLLQMENNKIFSVMNNTECVKLLQEIKCAHCSPNAQNLFHTPEKEALERELFLPFLCKDYCKEFYYTCRGHIPGLLQTTPDDFCFYYARKDGGLCFPDFPRKQVRGPASNYLDQMEEYGKGEDIGRKHKHNCFCIHEVVSGLRQPVGAVHSGDGSQRLFILEKEGYVKIFTPEGELIKEPFLDTHKLVQSGIKGGDERGLLSLAFHPNYKKNGKLYVSYTTNQERWAIGPHDHILRVVEYTVSRKNPHQVDMRTARGFLEVAELHRKHLGGQLLFGPDGFLYIFLGDGMITIDDMEEMDGLSDFTGSVLRLDVDTDFCHVPYSIPWSNPHFNSTNQPPEIFAHGLHNPGRCAVDHHPTDANINLTILCSDSNGRNRSSARILQIIKGKDYESEPSLLEFKPFSSGPLVGGFVYRGCQSERLYGAYIFADRNGNFLTLQQNPMTKQWQEKPLCLGNSGSCRGFFSGHVLGFGEDELGEVYIVASSKSMTQSHNGKLYKIVDPKRPLVPEECKRTALPAQILTTECSRHCRNGHCTPTGKCCCNQGWEGEFCRTAKCDPACRHGGVCIRPNKCLCKKGYLGAQCEQMDRNIRRVTRAGILDQIIDMTSYLLDLTSYIV